MKKTITFDLRMTTRPVILNSENYATTIMEEPIDAAVKIFDKIITQSENCMAMDEKSGKFDADWSFRVNNNVIAFLGDRGSGKTSCMLSVANILKKRDINNDFYFLQIIDPSFFDETHNILDLFVGELYKRFKTEATPRSNYDRDEIMKINSSFIDLKSDMRYLAEPPISNDDYSGAETLEFLCSGVYLQSSLRKAISAFLKFTGKKRLVICIDDLDINVKRSYLMMEQIRKYLVMPEIIILLSAKIEQLHSAIRLDLMNVYSPQTSNATEEEKVKVGDTVSIMAERYLSKFLPQSQRVYMPKTDVLLDSALTIVNESGESTDFDNVADGVTDMIFHKTRYLFYNSDGNVSLIVPRNLRNLSHLIKLLFEMPDFDGSVCITTENTPGAKQNLINKARFKNYFFTDWTNLLSSGYQSYAQTLISEEPDHLNKPVIKILNASYPYYFDEPYIQTDNVYYNISVGDTMTMLEAFTSRQSDNESRLFSFFVKSLYSMRLYEAYDRLTDFWNNHGSDNAAIDYDRPHIGNSMMSDVPEYFRLTGGNLISPDRTFELIPKDKQKARDRRILDGNVINSTIHELLIQYRQCLKAREKALEKNPENESDIPLVLPEGFIDRLHLMEFFAYTTVRYVEGKDRKRVENLNDKFRTDIEVYYLRNLSGTKNILFDVAAPLVKLADPQSALMLYGKDFLDMCLDLDDDHGRSLINTLYHNPRYGGAVDRRSDLASRVATRNIEVLEDIVSYLKRKRDSLRPEGGGDLKIYIDFFKYLADYNISTYTLDSSSKKHHKITLQPVYVLAETLEKCSKSAELADLFYDCFATEEDNLYPEKGSPESQRIMSGFNYKPDMVRNIIKIHYPEYTDNDEIISLLKFPKLNTMDGENIVNYLAKQFGQKIIFSKAIGEDLQDHYDSMIAFSPSSSIRLKKFPVTDKNDSQK